MLLSNQPTKVRVPFANAGTKNTIPVPSQIAVTPGGASFNDGFPPLTFTPVSAGGVPPAGADFNGILNAITAIQRWQCGGGLFTYDAAWSTANSGYPKGALLLKADGTGYWQNLVDGNANDPDAAGADWLSVASGVATSSATQAGTSTTLAVSPKGLADTMLGGAGQAWTDVLASRAVATTYTNSTGRPIVVSIAFFASGASSTLILTVDSLGVSSASIPSTSATTVTAVVPNGGTYSVAVSGASSISGWFELR